MFVNNKSESYLHSQKLADIQSQLGHQGNQYIFLRSIWKSHSHLYANTIVDLDDQLDRLNKIVGMMKKHITYSAKKQLAYQNNNCYDQISVRESKALQAMSRAMLESEQYRTRLAQVLAQNQQIKKTNKQLKQQIQDLKIKRKQDTRTIKQLTQKTATLQNKILASGYEQSKSQTSFMRSSRNFDKQNNDSMKQSSVLNRSITDNIHMPHIKSDRSRKLSKGRYSNQQSDQKWLNQSVIEDLDTSMLSVSSYGFFNQVNPSIARVSSYKQNKQNLEQSRFAFQYESQRNLLKQKSLKKNRIKQVTKADILGESPKQGLKFIRQNSKKTLLRKSQKLSETSAVKQQCN